MIGNAAVVERQGNDKQALVDALKEMPIIQIACKRVGVSRATYYRWRKEDKEFLRLAEDAMEQGYAFVNDMSESQGNKIYEQFVREIAPSGESGTRVIALGNLIDKNSFLMRLRSDTQDRPGGIFRAYPFIDSYRIVLWPEKFPDKESLNRFMEGIQSGAWTREYCLDAVSDAYYYDKPGPTEEGKKRLALLSPSLLRMRKAKQIYRRALEKDGKIRYQEAIILPMKKFSIESPLPFNLMDQSKMGLHKGAWIDPSAPAYAQEYQKEMQAATEEFKNAHYADLPE